VPPALDTRIGPAPGPFVGRANELHLLERLLSEASGGAPQLVLVTGTAGLGKTRLLDEFSVRAVASGALVLRGACQEDVGVPYLPVATALAPLGDVFRGLEDVNPVGTEANRGDGRLRLFLTASNALLDAAAKQTVVVVLEDVHWVDDATLALLRHLVSVLTEEASTWRARLMLVVATRAPGTNAAATFVTRLARAHGTRRIDLGPLNAYDCRQLIGELLDERPSRATVDRLLEATQGNPLVLRSALARLRDVGASVNDSAIADVLGETDLDGELWRRVEAASRDCREMLLTAAFLGDGTTINLLAIACDEDRAVLDRLIDEACERQVLQADGDRYWFDHPQLRQLVYHWPTGRDRARRHHQIATRIASDAPDIVVAHHLVRAGDLVDPQRMVTVCDAAAQRAASIGARRDAARYSAAALRAASNLDLDDEGLAALQLSAGNAAILARDRDAGIAHLTAATESARACGALRSWGASLLHLARERLLTSELRSANAQSLKSLDEFLAAAEEHEPELRAEVHALEAELYFSQGESVAALRHALLAETLAGDDDELRGRIAFARGLHHLGVLELDDACDQFEAGRSLLATAVDQSPRLWCITRLGLLAMLRGDLDRAEALLAEALELAPQLDNDVERSMASALAAAVAALRGRLATAELHGERARQAYRASPYWFTPGVLYPALAAARAARGDARAAQDALDAWDEAAERRPSRRYRPLVEALLGDVDAACATLDANPFRLFAGVPVVNVFQMDAVAAQVELAALTAQPGLVQGPVETLVDLYERGIRFTVGWPSFVPRVVALGYAATGHADEAEQWFVRAMADAQRAGATLEVARTALDHARCCDAQADADPAVTAQLFNRARATYTELSIRPLVPGSEQIAHTVAPADAAAPGVTRIVLVTDIVGSTPLNDVLGDQRYLEYLRQHDDIIRRRLAQHDGVEFKHTGDGVAAWFFSVNGALQCAVALAEDFARSRARNPLQVKIGLSAGVPTVVDRDLFGIAVTVAFRVTDCAAAGEVLVTADVARLASGTSWAFESRGAHSLKGVRQPVDLYLAFPLSRAGEPACN
jgi:class 3 adenylate cyclase/tetratricopeptide (TPR) repeat protein